MNPKILLVLLLLLASCQNNKPIKNASTQDLGIIKNPITEVVVSTIEQNDFRIKKIVNGKLEADRKVLIKFERSGYIKDLAVINGKYIEKNSSLAILKDDDLQMQLHQLQDEWDIANVKKNDLLISNGGEYNDESSVPKSKLEIINITSGINKINSEIDQVKLEVSKSKTLAPFSGLISDLEVKPYQWVNTGETLCTLFDPNSFEVVFFVVESTALHIKYAQKISISPISMPNVNLTGRISKINPVVNANGLVELRARIDKSKNRLFEGMNLEVFIEEIQPNQLIVPKEALVTRSGKNLVFVFDETENLAKWVYIDILYENEESLAVSGELNPKDRVIIEGNSFLEHDAKVKLIE